MAFNNQDLESAEKIAPSAEATIIWRRILFWVANGPSTSGQQAGVKAAPYSNNYQVKITTPTVAQDLVSPRATRRSVLIRNLDDAINVYVGSNPNAAGEQVSTTNGMLLKPGEGVNIEFTGVIQGICASGTPTLAIWETYD